MKVVVDQCKYEVLSTKIEIKLKKQDPTRHWVGVAPADFGTHGPSWDVLSHCQASRGAPSAN